MRKLPLALAAIVGLAVAAGGTILLAASRKGAHQ